MKTCTKCKETKDLTDFPKRKRNKDGRCTKCKICTNKANREWQVKTGWKAKDPGKYYRENKDKVLARQKRAREERPQTEEQKQEQRNARYLRVYGISIKDYNTMLKNQKNCCAICGVDNPQRGGSEYFMIDHCHETGKVRGLLCHLCNSGLGRFKDSKQFLLNALSYLEDS